MRSTAFAVPIVTFICSRCDSPKPISERTFQGLLNKRFVNENLQWENSPGLVKVEICLSCSQLHGTPVEVIHRPHDTDLAIFSHEDLLIELRRHRWNPD